MTDYITRADAMAEFREYVKRANENGETPTWNDAVSLIGSLPSADAVDVNDVTIHYKPYPSDDAVPIHEDGTLEVKVPNAQKVGRVLVMDTDSHIGGGLFYPDDAVQGEWLYVENEPYSECSKCGRYIDDLDEDKYAYCPYCGARMKGGAE